jgi:DNA-binding CsgD family transcriptional regulator
MEQVLDGIYDAAPEPALWPRALDRIGDRFGGSPLLIWLQEIPQKPSFIAISRLNPALQPVFFDRYTTPETHPAIPFLMAATPGVPFDFVAKMGGNSAFQRTQIYADLFVPERICSQRCAAIIRNDRFIAPLVLQGRLGCAPLTSAEDEELAFLLRHIGRSLRVTARLLHKETETASLAAILDRLDLAVMTAGPDGRIRFLNQAAEQIIRARDGLTIEAGRLIARHRDERTQLDRLMAAATSKQRRGGGTLGISRPSGASRYGVEVIHSPLRATLDQELPGAIIFVTDPAARPRPSNELLTRIYGLTSAEARVAISVAEGNGLTGAAEALGVSTNTVKTLLHRAFAKTDTRRQSELVALVTRLTRFGPSAD